MRTRADGSGGFPWGNMGSNMGSSDFFNENTGGAQRQMGLYLRTFLKTLGSLFGPCNSTKVLFTAMPCEVQLNTLQGSVITLDVVMTATIGELKSMLLEKHPFQSNERL